MECCFYKKKRRRGKRERETRGAERAVFGALHLLPPGPFFFPTVSTQEARSHQSFMLSG